MSGTNYGLDDFARRVLNSIAKHGPVTCATLAKTYGSSVRTAVNGLRDQGYVVSRVGAPDAEGKRPRNYSVSAKGRTASREAAPVGSTVCTRAASRMAFSDDVYMGDELSPYSGRPGAMDAFSLPSRVGRRRYYRNGAVEMLDAHPEGGEA